MDAGRGNELARVFEAGFGTDNFLAPLAYLQSKYRVFRLIPDAESRRISHSRETYHKYGAQFVQEKERAILEEESKLINGTVSGKSARARDLLSALIRANRGADVAESELLTDEGLVGQIALLFSAGHETTSVTAAWLLHELSLPSLPTEALQTNERSMSSLR